MKKFKIMGYCCLPLFLLGACSTNSVENKTNLKVTEPTIKTLKSGEEIVNGDLIVILKKGTEKAEMQRLADKYGMKINRYLGIINGYHLVSSKSYQELSQTKRELEQESAVNSVEYNRIMHLNNRGGKRLDVQ